LEQAQAQFDHWRGVYNHERPHEALSTQTPPAQRHAPSLPGALPPIEYGPDDRVRKVRQGGWISFRGQQLRVSKALVGQPVALRPCIEADGLYKLYFCHHHFHSFDSREAKVL
jgi:hypothetical protein